ncbi:MAG: prepilin-type N-terminal cleavage/methylation domain-containing protein [Armatimonadetes bacterium]|nr:prepilin-type N-terminal cleavage/methylation domain-containing protein [Armatimonadota bacterium]
MKFGAFNHRLFFTNTICGMMNSSTAAFTLLELLIALAITVIAVVGIVRGVSNGLMAVQSLSKRNEAINLARMKMEELLTSMDEQTDEQEGGFGEAFPQFRWEAQISDAQVEGLKVVTVRVIWREGVNERAVSLSTLIGQEKLTSLPPSESDGESQSRGEPSEGESLSATTGGGRDEAQ